MSLYSFSSEPTSASPASSKVTLEDLPLGADPAALTPAAHVITNTAVDAERVQRIKANGLVCLGRLHGDVTWRTGWGLVRRWRSSPRRRWLRSAPSSGIQTTSGGEGVQRPLGGIRGRRRAGAEPLIRSERSVFASAFRSRRRISTGHRKASNDLLRHCEFGGTALFSLGVGATGGLYRARQARSSIGLRIARARIPADATPPAERSRIQRLSASGRRRATARA